ncbi:MAG TPA: anion permease [Elusimicrobia bacterium]|nr:anion permease [Elusimicrobiota bacterium]HBT61557.1 anion permease [Elusimicrobiota bacterium]
MIAVVIIMLAVGFDFVNGFHDASNVVATMISTRAFQPETALIIAAAAEFLGPFLFGTAVARVIGQGIIDPEAAQVGVILAALFGAIAWNIVTWYFGLPSSSSHALVGGLAGAVLAAFGFSHLKVRGFVSILIVLFASPIIGLMAGYWFQKILIFLSRGATPRINELYKRLQIVSAVALALSHGTNDAQKAMGIITMTLVSMGALPSFAVPVWTVGLCAGAMGLGTAIGGWRIIKTVGDKIYRLRPINGFAAQSAAASVIMSAAVFGGPVSTTHVVSSAIAGVGSAERIKAVRWNTAFDIFLAWIVTIPAAALLSGGTYLVMRGVWRLCRGL